jgi:Ca2+-binding EF-hand superfamily protein
MLTEFQKQKLPRLFDLHDRDRDGVLTRADFEEFARSVASSRGWSADSAESQELLSRFLTFWNGLAETAGGAGRVTATAWLDYWDRILGTPGMFDEIAAPIARLVFTILDQDDDGFVTAGEYAGMYGYSGLDPAEAAPAFARLDVDHDGRLSVDEIMQLVHQFFRSENPTDPGNLLFGPVPGLAARA